MPSGDGASVKINQELLFKLFLIASALIVLTIRLPLAAQEQLWLDETWTGMIAEQVTWGAFWEEAWLDVNPPLYYALMKVWTSLFGDTNLVLRLPSIIFFLLAAISAIALRPRVLNAVAAWLWAGLIFLWSPGALVMIDARSYALLIFLSTLSCIYFMRLCDDPNRKDAMIWVAIGTAMFLTHYYTAVLLGAQAIVLFALHRKRLLALWPAALFSIPGLAWFAFHIGRLSEYSQPEVVWYKQTTFEKVYSYLLYILGISYYHFIVLLFLVVGYAIATRKPASEGGDFAANKPVLAAVGVAILAYIMALAIGFFQPSLAARYMAPLVPFALLSFVLIAQRSRRQVVVSFLFVAIIVVPSFIQERTKGLLATRTIYGFERVSDFVLANQPDHVTFAWDHPATVILRETSLEKLGSYFIRRQDAQIETIALRSNRNDDLNELLKESASQFDRPGIIWLYNTTDRSAAGANPPRIQDNQNWSCLHETRVVKEVTSGALGCVRIRPESSNAN